MTTPEPGRDARALLGRARALHADIDTERTAAAAAAQAPAVRRAAARSVYLAARTEIARAQLANLPLDRIKDITQGRLRINTIERAGYRTVADILGAGRRLEYIPALGPAALGPITGSVPAAQRQAMIDEFTAQTGPAVLVAQINAGGVGFNIQAASVVIICEPQWNPAIEEQAIGRAHRMGQVRRVDVHRLLSEDGVDARMLEITQAKRAEFDEYARRSDLAASTPDAIDIADLDTVKEVASQAEQERRILEQERKRLRLESRGDASPT